MPLETPAQARAISNPRPGQGHLKFSPRAGPLQTVAQGRATSNSCLGQGHSWPPKTPAYCRASNKMKLKPKKLNTKKLKINETNQHEINEHKMEEAEPPGKPILGWAGPPEPRAGPPETPALGRATPTPAQGRATSNPCPRQGHLKLLATPNSCLRQGHKQKKLKLERVGGGETHSLACVCGMLPEMSPPLYLHLPNGEWPLAY